MALGLTQLTTSMVQYSTAGLKRDVYELGVMMDRVDKKSCDKRVVLGQPIYGTD